MLKIYRCKTEYEIHNEDRVSYLFHDSDFVICDEDAAVNKTIDFGAYTVEAKNAYSCRCDIWPKKKGKTALYSTWDRSIYLRQWKAPNAKLVMHITYEEEWCSMKRLMQLPAPDVIAYLKQEGMNLTLTN